MPIDNQLCRARVGSYNCIQLHHFTNLNTNPANSGICFILKFSNFYIVTVCLIVLTYFSVYLILTQFRNYGFNINKFNIANVLLMKYFDFCCYAFNLKLTLLLESGDIDIDLGDLHLLNFVTGT